MDRGGGDGNRLRNAKWRVALVVSILKAEMSVAEVARQHGLPAAENALRTWVSTNLIESMFLLIRHSERNVKRTR